MTFNLSSSIQQVALKLIKAYQLIPLLSHSQCRYLPTCSQYAYQAIQKYGILKGSFLGLKRILSCHPFGRHGPDPLK